MQVYRNGSLHIISQAKELSTSGSGSGTGILLIASMKPPPFVGDGIPPCTQKIYRQLTSFTLQPLATHHF